MKFTWQNPPLAQISRKDYGPSTMEDRSKHLWKMPAGKHSKG